MSGPEKRLPLRGKQGHIILDEFGFYVPEVDGPAPWWLEITRAVLIAITGALIVTLLWAIQP